MFGLNLEAIRNIMQWENCKFKDLYRFFEQPAPENPGNITQCILRALNAEEVFGPKNQHVFTTIIKLADSQVESITNPRDIAVIIFEIGKILASHKITSDATIMRLSTNLTSNLSKNIPNAQNPTYDISSSIYALSKLAENNVFSDSKLSESQLLTFKNNLTTLLQFFVGNTDKSNKLTMDIANTIYGLGKLAEFGMITPPAPNLSGLLVQLFCSLSRNIETASIPTQDIANTIYGLGKLAEFDIFILPNQHVSDALAILLNCFSKKILTSNDNMTMQSIANIMFGLGKLDDRGLDTWKVANIFINIDTILQYFCNNAGQTNRPTQHIANIIFGLGTIADTQVSSSQPQIISCNNLAVLLQHFNNNLHRSDRPTQHIANIIFGLGKLADSSVEVSRATGIFTIISNLLTCFIKNLDKSDRPKQHIANIIFGLGKLAEAGVSSSQHPLISNANLTTLLQHFNSCINYRPEKSTQNIINIMWALTFLDKANTQHICSIGGKLDFTKAGQLQKGLILQLARVYGHLVILAKSNIDISQQALYQQLQTLYEQTKTKMQQQKPPSSYIHINYTSILRTALGPLSNIKQTDIQEEYYEYGLYIDIVIINQKTKYAIEINGKCHYEVSHDRNRRTLKHKNLVRTEFLESLGWTVLNFDSELCAIEEHVGQVKKSLSPAVNQWEQGGPSLARKLKPSGSHSPASKMSPDAAAFYPTTCRP